MIKIGKWDARPVSEMCCEIIDCVNKTAPSVEETTPFKMIRTTNVRDGWVDVENVKYVEEDVFERWVRRGQPQRGDVILTREAPLGAVGMLRSDDQVFLGQRTVMYRADEVEADERFLLYALMSPWVQAEIRSLGSGATVEHMRVPDCERLLIPAPPLRTQKRIGAALGAFDDLIENNRRRTEILEEMARLLYREWFEHFRFPGHESVELVDSELGPIPEGWKAAVLRESASFVGGSTTTKAAYVDEGFTAFSAAGPDGFLPEFDVDDHGVVLSAVGARCGRTFRASGKWSSIANTIKILPDNDGFAAWLYFVTSDPAIWPRRGSAHPFVSINDARGVRVLTPSRESAARFEDHTRPMLDLQDNLEKQNRVLRKARDLLLPRLVSGELDVSDLDLDGVLA